VIIAVVISGEVIVMSKLTFVTGMRLDGRDP
jgi:hypothetical protein